MSDFVNEINDFKICCHQNAIKHGFWDDPETPAGLIALMHSELSEALEGIRKPTEQHIRHIDELKSASSKKIPGFSNLEEEFADVIIRILDFAGRYKLHIGEAILAKHEFNKSRPYKHGKEF